ncbi:MAG: radical SAM protein [Deltaproteobacteria bacterium]|nr:radical SAM protein [Deltaproteobacteria bacterium]
MRRSRFSRALRRGLHPLYRSLETSVHPLRYLFLEVTRKCNLRCLHCGSDCGADPSGEELSTAQWLAFVDDLAVRFDPRRIFLVFTGGEPLCRAGIFDIMKRARDRGFAYGMVTNGFGLTAPHVRTLVDLGLMSATVSLDGGRESHDWLRGTRGSFERAMTAIRALCREDLRFFDVVTCVNPRNLTELPRVLDLLREAGVRAWRLFSIFPKGRARDNPELLLSCRQVKELLAWIGDTRRALEGSGFAVDFSCEGYLPPRVDRAVRSEPYFCRAGISIGSVLVDGSIAACPNIDRSLVQGSILRDDFKAVWDGRFEPFRVRDWMRTGPCTSCGQWSRCRGNSLHLWDGERGETALCHHRLFAVEEEGGA